MASEDAYSRRQIDRAGDLLRDFARAHVASDSAAMSKFEIEALAEAVGTIDWWRSRHARPLARVNAGLRHYIAKVEAPVEVTQRLKRFSTIVDKLGRQPGMRLSRMEDIGGVRLILPTQDQAFAIVDALHKARRWEIRRQRFYVDGHDPGPKSDGYRAVHLIVARDGCFIEVQLRTPWQDTWAQSVEQDTRRLRQELKFGGGPDDLRAYYKLASEYMALRERNLEVPEELVADLAKLYRATRQYFPSTGEDSPPGRT